ncbi:MAG: hypothetical protein C0501_14600 [Isosphaera sp.]|nr:hypothetical protein [Isosphaera sp.]
MSAGVPPRTRGETEVRAQRPPAARAVVLPPQRLVHDVTPGGVALLLAAVAALVWANSAWGEAYVRAWETPLAVELGSYRFGMTVHHWVNDGLMAVFFFAVALEVKREALEGHLPRVRTAALPVAAAVGGMAVTAGLCLAAAGG